MAHKGDVGTEIAPAVPDDSALAARIDDLLHRTCDLARALTSAEQAALKVELDGAGPRKFFNLSEHYERWRHYRVDPQGLGLHALELATGQVVRLTQSEVEAHPAWQAFGTQAGKHPPLRGWLATPVCAEDGGRYGLLQLSDKAGGADFTDADSDRIRELAAFAGATLDALRAARRSAWRSSPARTVRMRVVGQRARSSLRTSQREGAHLKEFSCGALVPGCGATFHAESEDEILQQIASHARDEHGMDEVPPEVVDTIRAAISER